MFVPTFSVTSPLRRSGAAVANLTTSIPRWTSPFASERIFPCSAVIAAEISSILPSRIRRKRLIQNGQELLEPNRIHPSNDCI
jgi:hypothetical protein